MEALYRLSWLTGATPGSSRSTGARWRPRSWARSTNASSNSARSSAMTAGRSDFAEGAEAEGQPAQDHRLLLHARQPRSGAARHRPRPRARPGRGRGGRSRQGAPWRHVIDPACGSGHFLLAAARRIATRLARIRADGARFGGRLPPRPARCGPRAACTGWTATRWRWN